MNNKTFAIGEQSYKLAVSNVVINGETKEIIPAFTKYSIRSRNFSKTMENVDVTKVLPTVFGFTSADIFRHENVELMDFYGNEIPKEVDSQLEVLVYLDKADNINLLDKIKEPLNAVVVECENVADAYNRVSTSFVFSQLPQKSEWLGLCEAVTSDVVLSQIREFANEHKVNGTVAQAYFGLRYTVAELKKAAITKSSPLGDDSIFRSREDVEKLYSTVSDSLTAKAAGQTRIARAVNACVHKYSVDDVISALDNIKISDRKAILEAPCDERGEKLLAYIAEWIGRQSVKSMASSIKD